MRKIDKICDRALKYKTWIDNIVNTGLPYPSYDPKNPYCHDLRVNLLYAQNGVCAYTEIELANLSQYSDSDWDQGSYTGSRQIFGQLDHFDSSLKTPSGWSWDNFFLVHSDINMKLKRDRPIYYVMKPDSIEYDPFVLLDYDIDLHIFMVNSSITDLDKIQQIKEMIFTLGLNYDSIKGIRERYLNTYAFSGYYLGVQTLEELHVYHFFTAFEMMKIKLSS